VSSVAGVGVLSNHAFIDIGVMRAKRRYKAGV
jgi:hypothetical protein